MKIGISMYMLYFSNVIFGNGGFFVDGPGGSGTVSNNYKSKDIAINKEVLKIDLKENEAIVNVNYIFENQSDKEVQVKLAFPGVIVRDGWERDNYKDIKDYEIKENNIKLSYKDVTGNKVEFPEQYAANLYSGSMYSDAKYEWKVTEFIFQANEKKNIEISYISPYYAGEYNISGIPETITPKMFKYLLHTGASWKGNIEDCYIEVTASNYDVKSLGIYPKNFTLLENKIIWKYKDFNPEIKDNLEILVTSPKEGYMKGTYSDHNIVKFEYDEFFRFIPVSEYTIKSKDTDPKYPEVYLSDNKIETAWAATGKNTATLEINFKKPVNLTKIGILPGFFYSESIYNFNNRIKKIEVEYSNKKKQVIEYKIVGFYSFFSLLNDFYWMDVSVKEKSDVIKGAYYYNREQKVSSIKITIQDVYPGSKYNDTCISEIRFIEKIKSAPKDLHRAG